MRSGARETSDTAPSTATVCATGDTCRGTHGRGWRQDREGSGCPSAISPTKQKRNTDTPTYPARPIQFSTPEALRRDKDPTTQNPVAAGDNRLVEWNEASETITPQATHTRGTMQDGGEKSHSANLDPTTIGNAATVPHPLNATPIVIMEPTKIEGNPDIATYSPHATTNATPTVGITKLITLPKMADRSSIKGRQKQRHTRSPPWSTT